MWQFWQWLGEPSWRRTFTYGASMALMAYVHYFLAYLVLIQIIYWLAFRPNRQQWLRFAAAGAFALMIWSPWMQTFFYQVNLLREIDGGSLGIASTTTATSWANIRRLMERATNGHIFIFVALLLFGVWRVRRHEYGLLLLWGLGVPVIALTLNNFANVYDQRYIVYLSIGLSSSIGVTIAALPTRILPYVGIMCFVALNLWTLTDHLPTRVPYRHILQRITENAQLDDVILYDNAEEDSPLVRWNINLYLDDELRDSTVASVKEAREYRRVWYVSGNLVQDGVQERFWQLERTHPLMLVTGRCQADGCFIAQLVEGAPQGKPIDVFESPLDTNIDRLPFYGADVDTISDAAVDVRLWWMVDQPTQLDYSMSLRLVDMNGGLVAQKDSPPVTKEGDIQPTSQLAPERMTIDWRTLDVASLPAGEYQLQLIVYQPIDAYNLKGEAGEVLSLQTIILP
jgi:hypothetical protein